jgi:hypothetical protein
MEDKEEEKVVYIDKKVKCEKGVIYVDKKHIGARYNNWTIIGYSRSYYTPFGKRKQKWLVKCDCGKVKEVLLATITHGRSKSCGCYFKKLKEKERLPDKIASVNNKFSMYRNSAKKRNIDFELTKEQFSELMHGDCFYCGAEPKKRIFRRKTSSFNYCLNGIDRVDSNLGYTIENSISCCDTCNRAKLDHSLEYFLEWVEKVSKRLDIIKEKINT